MRKNTWIFCTIIIFMIASLSTEAKCRKTAKVKYEIKYGWSKLYTVEVIFLSGYELNAATNSLDYSSFSHYAVIFWGRDKASVIELSTILFCGLEVDCNCIENTIMDLEGYDQNKAKWNICLNSFCF